MRSRVFRIAPLLFGSGLTSLVYQVAWMRELRLTFGFSTAASAAVLAIFMGGLGLGSWLLGRRADASDRPLLFYGRLELGIAASAAATPFLMWLVRQAYIALGGSFALGLLLGTLVRVLLSALVLLIPTILMGGTLPAAARAAETDQDSARRRLAFLYGANTLGAVAGATISTFWLLELLGTRATLWTACVANFAVGLMACRIGKGILVRDPEPTPDPHGGERLLSPTLPFSFVFAAAGAVGFAFMLMELVWYRMLAPLLGGSTYTFGLILAIALAGIGLGSAAYARSAEVRRATVAGLAATCGLEALCLAVAYALGDRVALLAVLWRSMGAFGFLGYVAAWAAVTCLVVLPAAFASGVQFPLLVALLGQGQEKVGEHVGLTYAWNTVGAIAGSLAGGFGLIPVLSARGAWVAVVLLLAGIGLAALLLSHRLERRWRRLVLPAVAIVASVFLLRSPGPTAAWRHSPIGAGRVRFDEPSPNALEAWLRDQRRSLHWEADGRESSVSLLKTSLGYAFAINGKVDGNSRGDAATQVMSGLLGAILHPSPRRSLVVGLGTGSTAGWLGTVPSMIQVDVVELEPTVQEVARACTAVNQNVSVNPKVRILIGDAREMLLTSRTKYDVIFSEPSNPYRAGISSLFTREFYGAVGSRLATGGVFIQWLQAYEVDSQTVRTTYATLASAFPFIESWFTEKEDLLLVASREPIRYPEAQLRRRLQNEPFRSGMAVAWRVTGLEGLLSHYLANPSLAAAIARQEKGRVNSDDRNLVEFAFARSLGSRGLFQIDELRQLARSRREDHPEIEAGQANWADVGRQRLATLTAQSVSEIPSDLPPTARRLATAFSDFVAGKLGPVRGAWLAGPWDPEGPVELSMVGEALADGGKPEALDYAERLRGFQPAEADAIIARFLWSQKRWGECFLSTAAAFRRFREDPWPLSYVMNRLMAVAVDLPSKDARLASPVFELLTPPFSLEQLDQERVNARITVAHFLGSAKEVEALAPLEPDFPWQLGLLELRARVYREAGHPRAKLAERELRAFSAHERSSFSDGLKPLPSSAPPGAPGRTDH